MVRYGPLFTPRAINSQSKAPCEFLSAETSLLISGSFRASNERKTKKGNFFKNLRGLRGLQVCVLEVRKHILFVDPSSGVMDSRNAALLLVVMKTWRETIWSRSGLDFRCFKKQSI